MLYEHPDVDVTPVSRTRASARCSPTIQYTTWKRQRKFLDPETEAMFKDLEAKLPGYEVSIVSTDRNETSVIVATFGDKSRGQRYLYDRRRRSSSCSPTCRRGCRPASSPT
jgi:hypothetical protein